MNSVGVLVKTLARFPQFGGNFGKVVLSLLDKGIKCQLCVPVMGVATQFEGRITLRGDGLMFVSTLVENVEFQLTLGDRNTSLLFLDWKPNRFCRHMTVTAILL